MPKRDTNRRISVIVDETSPVSSSSSRRTDDDDGNDDDDGKYGNDVSTNDDTNVVVPPIVTRTTTKGLPISSSSSSSSSSSASSSSSSYSSSSSRPHTYPCHLQITSLRCRGIVPDTTAKLSIGIYLRSTAKNTNGSSGNNKSGDNGKAQRNEKKNGKLIDDGESNENITAIPDDDTSILSTSLSQRPVSDILDKWESRAQTMNATVNWDKEKDIVKLGTKVNVLDADGLYIDLLRNEKTSKISTTHSSNSKNRSSLKPRRIQGSGKVSLDELKDPSGEGNWSGWVPIYHPKTHSLVGEIFLQLSLIGTLPSSLSMNDSSNTNTNDTNKYYHEYDGPPPNTLRITIHECRSLISLSEPLNLTNGNSSSSSSSSSSSTRSTNNRNNNSSSVSSPSSSSSSSPAPSSVSKLNPSVKVTVGTMELRTNMKSNTANPVFEETFVFPLTDRTLSSVNVTVESAGVLRSQPIAKIEFEPIDLSSLRGRKMRRRLPLMNCDGSTDRPRGEIDLTLAWEHTRYGVNYTNPHTKSLPSSSSTGSAASNLVLPNTAIIPRRLTSHQVAELDGIVRVTDTVNDASSSNANHLSHARGSPKVTAPTTTSTGMFGMGKKSTGNPPSYVPSKLTTVTPDENDDDLMQVPESGLDGVNAGVVDNDSDKDIIAATLKAREEAEKRQIEEAAALANSVMKEGDYTISVHIIEARMLKPEDPSGSSDPVVYVDVLGQKQHTRIIYKRNNCVWDQTLIFNISKVSVSELEQGNIKVSVFDADTFSANDLIGAYVLDIASVYAMPHHEVYRAWVGLMDQSSEVDRGIQGLLRISVTIMGPGDVPFIHPPSDENDDDAAESRDIMDTLLMPPSLERKLKFLVLTMYGAENLPCMDDTLVGAGGIDGFVKVQFAGLVAKTKWVNARGNSNLAVEWLYELWLPILVPTMNDMIEISVWDYDRIKENDRVGTVLLHFRDIDNLHIVPTWFPIYGAPEGIDTGAMKNRMNKYPKFASNYRGKLLMAARLEDDDGNEIEKVHSKLISRLPPEFMPRYETYRVRALVIMGDEIPTFLSTATGIFSLLGSDVGIMVSVGGRTVCTQRIRPDRGTVRWNSLLEFEVLLPAQQHKPNIGDDDDEDAAEEGNKGTNVREGDDENRSSASSSNDHLSATVSSSDIQQYDRWDGFSSPLPDTFIYLYRGEPTKGKMWHQRVCFARLSTSELIKKGFSGSAPYWQPLVEDQAVNAIGDDEKTGTILLRIGIEPIGDVHPPFMQGAITKTLEDNDGSNSSSYRNEETKPLLSSLGSFTDKQTLVSNEGIIASFNSAADEWRNELKEASVLVPYELRVHAYRGEDLPAADDDGSLDAYLRISLNGTTKRTGICSKSTNPAWYETISLPAMLPPLRLAPQVRIQLWDHDDITADDFVSEMRFNLCRPECIISLHNNLPIELPSPRWFDLGRYESKATNMDDQGIHVHHGKLLLSFQLIRKEAPTQIVRQIPPTIIPLSRDYYLELVILGLRSMEHYNGLPLFLPYIEFDLGDRSKTAKVKRTLKSRIPTSTDPNYCERLILPIAIPIDALFTGALNVVVRDSRLGGLSTPVIGTTSIKLRDKIPWSPSYRPPRGVPLPSSEHPGYEGLNHHRRRNGEEEDNTHHDHYNTDNEEGNEDDANENDTLLPSTTNDNEVRITIDKRSTSRKERVRRMSMNPYNDFTAIDMEPMGEEGDNHTMDRENDTSHTVEPTEIEMVTLPKSAKKEKKHKKEKRSTKRKDTQDKDPLDGTDMVKGSGTGLVPATDGTESVVNDGESPMDEEPPVLAKESKYPPMINEWGMDEAQHLQTLDGATEVEDDEAAMYMAGRRIYSAGLEEVITSTPFERFPIIRGQRVGRGKNPLTLGTTQLEDNTHTCGIMKGIIRVVRTPDEPPAFDLSLLKNAHPYVIRVYVLQGINLTPHDAGGTSDPYLVVKLGSTVISGRSEYQTKTVNPDFFKMFELKAMLPGPSVLSIETWDRDLISGDDYIGGTQIDLEDRWFEPAWQNLGKEYETFNRLRPKPVETRALWCPKSTASQGSLRLWIDILTPTQAARYPPVKIAPPPPQEYEIRTIIWGTRNIQGDSGGSDYFIRAHFHGETEQETDTHWRCKDGCASFNWRMNFTTTVPTKYPHLTIQLYDRDIVKYNDLLSEAVLDLAKPLRRAAKAKEPIQVFDTDPEVVGPVLWKKIRRQQKRLARRKAKEEAAAALAAEQAAAATANANPVAKAAWVNEGVTVSENEDPNRVGTEKAAPTSSNVLKQLKKKKHKHKSMEGKETMDAPPAPPPTETPEPPATDPTASLLASSPLGAVIAATPMGKVAATAGLLPTGGSAKETVDHLRKTVGTVQYIVKPRHAQYLPMYKVEYESGDMNYELVGEVLISVEIVPKDIAEKFPVGTGRKEPNQYPFLPEPIGRMHLNLNPLHLLTHIMGTKACIAMVVSTVASVGTAGLVLGAPFVDSMIGWMTGLSSTAQIAIWSTVGAMVLAMCICCCVSNNCRKQVASTEEADVYGSAADILSGEGAWDASAIGGDEGIDGNDVDSDEENDEENGKDKDDDDNGSNA